MKNNNLVSGSIIFIFLMLPFSTLAQETQYEKDSLRKVISSTKGEDKLKTYQVLSNLYYYESYNNNLKQDTLFAIYKEMKKEAEHQGEFKYAGFTLTNTLTVYESNKMFDEAIKIAPEHLDYYAKHELWNYYYNTYRILVKIYRHKGEYQKAIEEATKVYNEAKKQNHEYGMAIALYAMSNTYGSMKRLEDEEKYMRQSIELLKKQNIWTQVTSGYFYLCQCLYLQMRYKDAIKELNEYEKAIYQAEKYIFTRDNASWNNLWSIAANIYTKLEDYEKAESYCKKLEDSNSQDYRVKISILNIRSEIYEARKEYKKALEQIELRMQLENDKPSSTLPLRLQKARVLSKMGLSDDAYNIYMNALNIKDSLNNIDLNAQLDELRVQYEVDTITAEKERNRNYFLFALSGCILLAVTLGIWIYYNRQIAKKNKTLAKQIKELQAQQEKAEAELLTKFDFETVLVDNDLCPERRKDQLCIAIRNILHRERAYRDQTITRDNIVERLGTNKELFIDAFQYCFGMSFSEYVNSLRLKDSITLLEESDLTIEEISEKVGFGTVRTFQRQFQSKYNMSPKEYQKAVTK